MQVIIDPGAEVDIISESLAKSLGLAREDSALPRLEMANDMSGYCYGAYTLTLQIMDQFSRRKYITRSFYSIDRKGSLLLGMPFCHDNAIVIDFEAKAFRWKYSKESMRVEKPDKFARSIKSEATVYLALVKDVDLAGLVLATPKAKVGNV